MNTRSSHLVQVQKTRSIDQAAFGFTLGEVLVVIAIFGLLIALFLPAVQAARESARMLSCKNRIRQIALALHSHHDGRKCFPAGVEVRDKGICLNFESREGTNWLIEILPYLEEGSLFAQYDGTQFNQSPIHDGFRKTFVSTYTCPGDELGGKNVVPALGRVASEREAKIPYMTGSYRGVSGLSNGLAFLDADPPVSAGYSPRQRGVLHAVGAGLARFSKERFRTILDGKSDTLMIGESASQTNPGRHTLWAYSYQFYTLSAVTVQARTLDGDFDRCESSPGATGRERPCLRGWGGSHPGLLNFALADASVISISNLIDPMVLGQMATIDGEEVIASRN